MEWNKQIFPITLFLLVFLSCDKAEINPLKVDYDRAFEMHKMASTFQDSSDHLNAARYFLKAGEQGFEPNEAYILAALAYIKVSKIDSAVEMIERLVDLGKRDFWYFENTEDFKLLTQHPKYEKLKDRIIENEAIYNEQHKDINNVVVETSDIDNFWEAFELAERAGSQKEKVDIYRKEYFEKGTVGLRDFTFFKMRNGGIEGFTDFVEEHREYYAAIKEPVNEAAKKIDSLKYYFEEVQKYVPDATLSNYYFVVGMHTSFGTVSMNGSLIGIENVVDENTPVQLLPEHRRSIVAPASFLPWVLVHELIHTYQNRSNPTLIGATITEGTADFVTELILGKPVPKPLYRIYGEENETMLWEEFQKEMMGTKLKDWIAGVTKERKEQGWPQDLGYFIGYKIAKGYYENKEKKTEAIRELFRNENPMLILKKSGYMNYGK